MEEIKSSVGRDRRTVFSCGTDSKDGYLQLFRLEGRKSAVVQAGRTDISGGLGWKDGNLRAGR